MIPPQDIQIIGEEVAIKWQDGCETFYPMPLLRAASRSAENIGETDLVGNRYGGDIPQAFHGVRVVSWQLIGHYAIQFRFSDGHDTGLYTYDYLRHLAHSLEK